MQVQVQVPHCQPALRPAKWTPVSINWLRDTWGRDRRVLTSSGEPCMLPRSLLSQASAWENWGGFRVVETSNCCTAAVGLGPPKPPIPFTFPPPPPNSCGEGVRTTRGERVTQDPPKSRLVACCSLSSADGKWYPKLMCRTDYTYILVVPRTGRTR